MQVVGGGDYREEQKQQASQRDRELKNRLGTTPLPQPEISPRAKQQEPAQVEKQFQTRTP